MTTAIIAKPAASPLVTAATLPERLTLRNDMPGVYSGRVFVGTVERPCHFRAIVTEDGSIRLEDDTEAVAQILLDRARAKMARDEREQRAQVAKAGSIDEIARAALAEMVRTRSLTSLGTLRQRGVLNARQFLAGVQLLRDIKIAGNAQVGAGPAQASGRAALDDRGLGAVPAVGVARAVCRLLPDVEGMRPWAIVEDILIREKTLTETAGGTSRSVQRRTKAALRAGLEAVADAYEIPANSAE